MPKRFGNYTSLKYQSFTNVDALVDEILNLYAVSGFKDRIIGIYPFPTDLMDIDRNPSSPLLEQGIVVNQESKYVALAVDRPKRIGNYTPKNNKLLTYPYVYCNVHTGTQEADYVFDKSFAFHVEDNNTFIHFRIYGVWGENPALFIVPMEYDHMTINTTSTMKENIGQVPSLATSFIELLGKNGIVNKLIPIAAQAIAPTKPLKPLYESESYEETVRYSPKTGKPSSKKSSSSMTHPTRGTREAYENYEEGFNPIGLLPFMLGCVTTNNFTYSLGDTNSLLSIIDEYGTARGFKIHAFVKTIREIDARRVDDYFSMYGYACEKIKVPNRSVRENWTYTKTANCKIKGIDMPTPGGVPVYGYRSVPAKYMDKICSIYNHGITFWRDGAEVGDYTQSNLPVAQG